MYGGQVIGWRDSRGSAQIFNKAMGVTTRERKTKLLGTAMIPLALTLMPFGLNDVSAASSTHEIDAMIAAIKSQTDETVAAIRGINGTIEKLDENAAAIALSGEQQAEATGEISRHVRRAADGLLGHSADLDSQIDQFLEKIRAA